MLGEGFERFLGQPPLQGRARNSKASGGFPSGQSSNLGQLILVEVFA